MRKLTERENLIEEIGEQLARLRFDDNVMNLIIKATKEAGIKDLDYQAETQKENNSLLLANGRHKTDENPKKRKLIFEPSVLSYNKTKTTPCGVAFSSVSGQQDVLGTILRWFRWGF